MLPEIISRPAARRARLKYYYTGVPCANGHLALRLISNDKCIECRRELRSSPEYRARQRTCMLRYIAKHKYSHMILQAEALLARVRGNIKKLNSISRKLKTIKHQDGDWRMYVSHGARDRIRNWRRNSIPLPMRLEPTHCECCGALPDKQHLCADHDHITGQFRGWLCHRCNRNIARLGDTMHGLRNAFNYLQRFNHHIETYLHFKIDNPIAIQSKGTV